MSEGEELFALQLRAAHITGWEREYRFDKIRRWRFDFAWPDLLLAVEIEGGVYTNGRHTRGSGFVADCDKYEAALLAGWTVYRCTTAMIKNGRALDTAEKLIELKALSGEG